jgi:1-pyrroline-5-carboxylate dehydrogenase
MNTGLTPFRHEPYSDFRDPEVAECQRAAFAQVRNLAPKRYPLIIGGERVWLDSDLEVRNVSDRGELIARFQKAKGAHLEAAIRAAQEAFAGWSRTSPQLRCALLLQLASLLRRKRFLLNAAMSLENGKNWAEADGEVAESIDHCEYLARQVLVWSEGKELSPIPDEQVTLQYEPIGVVAVISPWNFPSAIPLGMTLGALAAGNTVVLKPASEAPISAYLLVEALEEAGLPAGVVNFLTGDDADLGDPLVDHPAIRMVAFTGSKEIGCRIYARAAQVQPGQRWLKRVIAEMGGKDATVVCKDADLEAASQGIVDAAFGYSGQKCSACSRVIAEESVYQDLLERVVAKTKQLQLGSAESNADVTPIITAEAAERIAGYIALGRSSAQLVCGGSAPQVREGGRVLAASFLEPTIFSEVPADSPLFTEEIFGPVLTFTRAKDLDQAFELANQTAYGLTGSVYSSDPATLERAKREFAVGNLYLNRKCSGALAGTHAFGGFHMSGTDAKVGGPDYLFYFLQAKTVALRY